MLIPVLGRWLGMSAETVRWTAMLSPGLDWPQRQVTTLCRSIPGLLQKLCQMASVLLMLGLKIVKANANQEMIPLITPVGHGWKIYRTFSCRRVYPFYIVAWMFSFTHGWVTPCSPGTRVACRHRWHRIYRFKNVPRVLKPVSLTLK